MLLDNNPISTKMFFHDKQDKTLSQELSTLRNPNFVRLYDDACDIGLVLCNHNTGNLTHWYVDKTLTDTLEEIYGWELRPCPETIRKTPQTKDYKIIVWND